jgi:transcription-repair coupling factor (superfamily II helicase)
MDQPVLDLSGLAELLRTQPAYQQVLQRFRGAPDHTSARRAPMHPPLGLISAARPFVVATLVRDAHRPVLVITSRLEQANNMAEQLLAWDPTLKVLTYTEPNPLFYERAPWGPRTTRSRLRVLSTWAALQAGEGEGHRGEAAVVVTSARALMQRTLPPDLLRQVTMSLKSGEAVPGGQPDALLRRWLDIGYEPVTVVTEPGQFSRRGGILDIYPVAADFPARIELWGDEIESLRTFDPATQRSLDWLNTLVIAPAREGLPRLSPRVLSSLDDWFDERSGAGEDEDVTLADDWRALEQGAAFPSLEFYLPWMYTEPASLLDYLPSDALIFVDDREDVSDTVGDLEAQALGLRKAREESGSIPSDMPHPLITWDELDDALAEAGAVELHTVPDTDALLVGMFTPGPRYGGQLRTVLEDTRKVTRGSRDRVVLISRQAERLAELSYEHGGARAKAVDHVTAIPEPRSVTFVLGALAQGWLMQAEEGTVHLLTDAEIFGWKRPSRAAGPSGAPSRPKAAADLAPGDVVVHAEYGIGRSQAWRSVS